MSKRTRKSTKQQQSRDDSQIQSSKAKRPKLESKQPTNVEFQLPGLLDLSILTPNHFQVFVKQSSGPGEFVCPFSITQQRTTGRYFISEYDNHRIQVLDENFTHRMFVGQQGSEPGQFTHPWGVAVSEEGRLVVCDSDNKRLQVFDINSDEPRFISMVNLNSSPFCEVMEEGTGRLFVSLESNEIGIVSMDGQLVSSFGSQGSNAGQLNFPVGVALNSRGDLFVGDSFNKRVSVFDNTGDYLCHFGSDADFYGNDGIELAIDSFDRIVVSDSYSSKLSMFDGGFKLVGQYGKKGSGIGQFYYPKGMCFDRKSNLVVCDSLNDRLQVISTTNHPLIN